MNRPHDANPRDDRIGAPSGAPPRPLIDGYGYLYPLEFWDQQAERSGLITVDEAGEEWGPDIPPGVVTSLLVQNMERPPWWRALDAEKKQLRKELAA